MRRAAALFGAKECAWPLAVVVLGLVFLFLFRLQVGRFLDRTRSVSKDGIRAYDDAQQHGATKPGALAQFLEGYHSPLLLEIEGLLEKEIETRGLTDIGDANKALRKSLAGMIVLLQFERLENAIWASQVAALIFLNGRADAPTPEANLEGFFAQAAAQFPTLYVNRNFQDWLGFCTEQILILEAKDGVTITVRGREFLKWRLEQGRSGPFYG